MKSICFSFFMIFCTLFGVQTVRAQVRDTMTFAVMGNSISTYYDYLPSGYAVYYSADREKSRGIQVGDTWWMQFSRSSGMTFLVNSSWSGSRVACDALNSNSPFVSTHRITSVGRNGVPDAILIAGGTNDWNAGKVPLGEYSTTNFEDSTTFRGAYTMLLHRLHTKYPKMKLICLSIFPRSQSFTQTNAAGWSMSDANASIKKIAQQFGGYYVDCTGIAWSSNWSKYTIDYLHPTTEGNKLLADCITKSLRSQGVITSALAQNDEVDTAPALMDLQFTADGMVNKGTHEMTVGSKGKACTLYDSKRDTYYGCTRVSASDYFYALFNKDDALANAFNNNVTWETLVRLDNVAASDNTITNTRFFSCDQDGGWSFYNSKLASSFSYTHQSGYKSIVKNLTGDSIMASGKFYHLVVTMDRRSHTIRYFVNGQLVTTGTRCATDMPLPQCGLPKAQKNMFICLGGDPKAGSYLQGIENSAASTFVFARIYDGALSQKGAQALYNDYVKQFTEPKVPGEVLMDCHFTPDGAVNSAPGFTDCLIEKVGDPKIVFNETGKFYEAQFNRTNTDFFKFNMGTEPAIMGKIADAYSVELYCKNNQALPLAANRPISCTGSFGFGLQMSVQGNIGYYTSTQGAKADGSTTKTLTQWVGAGQLTDEYTHYVISYDRLNGLAALYINGELKSSRTLTNKECNLWEWAPSEWISIGGDGTVNYNDATSVGTYSFDGNIVIARLWGKALTADNAKMLSELVRSQQQTFTTGSNGYVAVCVPFMTRVPAGVTAYIVTETTSTYAYIKPVAEAGDVLPYGAPVILKGTAKTEYTLEPIEQYASNYYIADIEGNLLVGCFAGKTLEVGEGYYQNTAGNCLYRPTATKQLPSCSCYLPSTAVRSMLSYRVVENTGLTQVGKVNQSDGLLYNIMGQPVNKSSKGIYIRNNKKILYQ